MSSSVHGVRDCSASENNCKNNGACRFDQAGKKFCV